MRGVPQQSVACPACQKGQLWVHWVELRMGAMLRSPWGFEAFPSDGVDLSSSVVYCCPDCNANFGGPWPRDMSDMLQLRQLHTQQEIHAVLFANVGELYADQPATVT